MKLHEYLQKKGRGAVADLSIAITAHAPDVSRWASGKRPVPEKAAVVIEKVTAGAVTRRDLRPDDWHLIWPELVALTPPTPVQKAT